LQDQNLLCEKSMWHFSGFDSTTKGNRHFGLLFIDDF
jgi:hypothetical protein